MAADLPHPATTTEMYLAAVLEELRALRAMVPVVCARPAGEIELREPSAKPSKKRG